MGWIDTSIEKPRQSFFCAFFVSSSLFQNACVEERGNGVEQLFSLNWYNVIEAVLALFSKLRVQSKKRAMFYLKTPSSRSIDFHALNTPF